MFGNIISFVDMDTEKNSFNNEFDYDRYLDGPVENTRKNQRIERIQAALIAIPCVMFVLLMFLDFRRWEVSILCVLPVSIAVILEFAKDREAQRRYDAYGEWELEMEERLQEYDE